MLIHTLKQKEHGDKINSSTDKPTVVLTGNIGLSCLYLESDLIVGSVEVDAHLSLDVVRDGHEVVEDDFRHFAGFVAVERRVHSRLPRRLSARQRN